MSRKLALSLLLLMLGLASWDAVLDDPQGTSVSEEDGQVSASFLGDGTPSFPK